MRNITTIILILYTLTSHCQEKGNSISLSYGYIADVMQWLEPGYGDKAENIKNNPQVYGKAYPGYSIEGTYSRKLNTEYWVSLDVQMATISYHYNDPCQLYWNEKKTDNYFYMNLSFKKNLLKRSKLQICPKIGLLYRHLTLSDVEYDITEDISICSIPKLYNQVFNDFGTNIGVECTYTFHNNFFIGLSLQGNYIFDIGLETLELSPTIGVNF